MSYLVLSAKHSPRGGLAAWWGPDRCGYYTDLEGAGRYTLAEALDICYPGHPKLPPSSFAVHEESFPMMKFKKMPWATACELLIPDGQPVQQAAGRPAIIIGPVV